MLNLLFDSTFLNFELSDECRGSTVICVFPRLFTRFKVEKILRSSILGLTSSRDLDVVGTLGRSKEKILSNFQNKFSKKRKQK